MSDFPQLHTQDITDVMAELERNDSPGCRALYDIAARGEVYSLNEETLRPLRRKGTVFSLDGWDSPVLTGDPPMEALPNAKQIRDMLYHDILRGASYHFSPTRGSPEKDGEAIVELLKSLENPHYSKTGSILCMQSPSFERLCYKVDWPSDGMLSVSEVVVAVSPADDAQHMDYSDHYTICALISGTTVWLAYPPLPHNIDALHKECEAIVKNGNGSAFTNLGNFQHGIVIIQRAGQTLVLPPFWIATSLTTRTSVTSTFYAATATIFPERVRHIDNYFTTVQLWSLGDTSGQQRLLIFATELIEHLQEVLVDNFPHYIATKIITEICRAYETLRTGLRRVLEAIEDKAIVRGLECKYRAIWLKFLEEKRKKSAACRLCNLRIRNMPARGTSTDRLRQHFIDFHCLRNEHSIQLITRK